MKSTIITTLLLLACFITQAQKDSFQPQRTLSWGHAFVGDTTDPLILKIRSYPDTTYAWRSSMSYVKDKKGKIIDKDSCGYRVVINYKLVPMGLFCDTTITSEGDGYESLKITVTMDMVTVFVVRFPHRKAHWMNCYVNKEFFLGRSKELR